MIGVILAAAWLCVAALWAFERAIGILDDLDRYAYPLLLVLLGGSLAVFAGVPRWRCRAELAAYTGVCAYFVTALFCFVVTDADNRIYTVGNTLQWLPLMYVVAFVAFPPHRAIAATAALFLLTLGTATAALFLREHRGWDPVFGGLLVNAFVVQALLVLMLSFFVVLFRRFEQARQQARMLEHFAYADGLTGIANRRGMERELDALALAPGRCVGLVLVDVDRFKSVNDTFGHHAGDALLMLLAQRIAREVRGDDLLARWGGEEFLVAAPGAPASADGAAAAAADTARLAERLRQAVRAAPMPASGPVTVSAGTTVWITGGEPLHAALRRADEGLYAAKARGRDRVEPR